MGHYIRLLKLTEEGMKLFKTQKNALEEINGAIEAAGGKLVAAWVTQGNYDLVSVIEAPDPETMKEISNAVKGKGYYRGQTLPAIPIDEFVETFGRSGHFGTFLETWFRADKKNR
jgi:uncharacterized protein with GYD domain